MRPLRVICWQPIAVVISRPFAFRDGSLLVKRGLYSKNDHHLQIVSLVLSHFSIDSINRSIDILEKIISYILKELAQQTIHRAKGVVHTPE